MNTAALRLLLQGLSQRAVAVADLPDLPRPVLGSSQLLLPAGSTAALHRAAVAHAAAHLQHSRPGQNARGRKPLALAVLSAVEDARVERLLIGAMPGARRWFAPFLAADAPHGLGFTALMARLDRVLADSAARDGHHWVQRAQQGFWALPSDAPPSEFAGLALVLANMLGQMRVPFDTQYGPGAAYRDDHSYLWDHGHTADEAPLPTASGTSAQPAGSPAATVLRECVYGEWHEKLGLWRPDWCRVQEHSPVQPRAAPCPRPRPRLLPPETEGENLDMSAAVAALADRRRTRSWDPRLFRRTRPAARASVLLLLDLSQSTLAAWGSRSQTVQEAQQQVALWLARQLAAHGARAAVHGFASNGRTEVAYWRAVDFGEACSAPALAALPVGHSTRLGAALRHARTLLAQEPGGHLSLVVLSDGQPWDIDVFESGHLLQDARRAVHELRTAGLRVACITPDAQGLAELAPVFGRAGLHRLDAAAATMRWLRDGNRLVATC